MLDFWALLSDLAEIKLLIYHYLSRNSKRAPSVNGRLPSAIDCKTTARQFAMPGNKTQQHGIHISSHNQT